MTSLQGVKIERLRGEHTPNMSESTKMVEASRTDVGDTLFEAEVGRVQASPSGSSHNAQYKAVAMTGHCRADNGDCT